MQFHVSETCPRCRKPVSVAIVERHPTRSDLALHNYECPTAARSRPRLCRSEWSRHLSWRSSIPKTPRRPCQRGSRSKRLDVVHETTAGGWRFDTPTGCIELRDGAKGALRCPALAATMPHEVVWPGQSDRDHVVQVAQQAQAREVCAIRRAVRTFRSCSGEIRAGHPFSATRRARSPCPFNFLSNIGRGSGTVAARSDMDGRSSSER
jgi:hypothetical protein